MWEFKNFEGRCEYLWKFDFKKILALLVCENVYVKKSIYSGGMNAKCEFLERDLWNF